MKPMSEQEIYERLQSLERDLRELIKAWQLKFTDMESEKLWLEARIREARGIIDNMRIQDRSAIPLAIAWLKKTEGL